MKDKAKLFLTVGIVFLVIGIILGMYTREKKKTEGDKKDK